MTERITRIFTKGEESSFAIERERMISKLFDFYRLNFITCNVPDIQTDCTDCLRFHAMISSNQTGEVMFESSVWSYGDGVKEVTVEHQWNT